MKKLTCTIVCMLASCNMGQPSLDKTSPLIDPVKTRAGSDPLIAATSILHKPIRSKKELLGVWSGDNKEILNVEINEDSIYYIEHFEAYKYDLKGDSIFIAYPDLMFSAKVFFTLDTLVMESESGQSKYHRLKD